MNEILISFFLKRNMKYPLCWNTLKFENWSVANAIWLFWVWTYLDIQRVLISYHFVGNQYVLSLTTYKTVRATAYQRIRNPSTLKELKRVKTQPPYWPRFFVFKSLISSVSQRQMLVEKNNVVFFVGSSSSFLLLASIIICSSYTAG